MIDVVYASEEEIARGTFLQQSEQLFELVDFDQGWVIENVLLNLYQTRMQRFDRQTS